MIKWNIYEYSHGGDRQLFTNELYLAATLPGPAKYTPKVILIPPYFRLHIEWAYYEKQQLKCSINTKEWPLEYESNYVISVNIARLI